MTLNNIRRSLIVFLLLISGYGIADQSSWKVQTKENLKFLFEKIKDNHPEGRNQNLKLGRAYGMSLDKVKFVEDENQFRHAMVDFINILGSENMDVIVSSEVPAKDEREILYSVELPHGKLTFIIFKSCSL